MSVTTIERSALLPYPAEQMFALIDDIATYPHFMDGCVGAEVLRREPSVVEARLDLAKAGLRYSLTTRNVLSPPSRIAMELVEGPFSEFQGCWEIRRLDAGACKVSLVLQFALSSRALHKAASLLFNPLADNLVGALVKRADQLHGRAPT